MTSYYVVKTQEVENAADEIIHNQELELHQQKQIQQKLQIEYEDVQKSLSIEQETSKKLEATLGKIFNFYDSSDLFFFLLSSRKISR